MIIPVFKFGSKELEAWKNQFMETIELVKDKTEYCVSYNFFYTTDKKTPFEQTVWKQSGIQYIVDHGSFTTLETSIRLQQHTNSQVITC